MSIIKSPRSSVIVLALLGLGSGLANLSFFAPAANAVSLTSAFDRNPSGIPTTVDARNALNSFLPEASAETINFGTSAADVTLSGNGFVKNNLTFTTSATAESVTGLNDLQARGFNTTGSAGTYADTSGFRLQILPSNNSTLTFTFEIPVLKFGFIATDYGNSNINDGFVSFVFRDAANNIIPNSISGLTNLNNGQTGSNLRNALLLGFEADPTDNPIKTAVITIRNSGTDRFSIDDIRAEPIPFEFNPVLGFGAIAAIYISKTAIKKFKKNS